ncbi:phosphoribosylglycinamide formyltransferase [Sphingomonas sinipercae]|uniref:Phosphoribosylglycinamide formyltransferase n=1 Tax=Sphingomonas sinipercae TaxID=2714944 RepID=A0A6G7ZMW4_9SPHN|nr:phosphoribosylglycinamide formyltransferase [Sphingomonas sinipercae]QIL02259.1 phosphoribosylglycinamide formyltransferase [Sphingomonas sinipercae]
MHDPARVAVLISGRGSNMRALVERASGYEVALVASNRPEAAGLDWARARQLPTWTWDSRGRGKAEFEAALNQALDDHRIGTIALAGFMQILTAQFTQRWAGRVLNIHPSLLPKYRGLDTHKRALEAGDKVAGCSVHLVTEELDAGDVLARAEVPVLAGDDAKSLEERVLAAEHRLYPEALGDFVSRQSPAAPIPLTG